MAVGMCSNFKSIIFRDGDDCFELFVSKLWILTALGLTQYATCCRNFDQIGTFLVALPDCFSGIFDAVYNTVLGTRIAFDSIIATVAGIAMTASCGECCACSVDTRPNNVSAVDGVAH